MYVRARPRDRERARERARKSVWATLCASSVRMLPQPLASPLPGQRAACAIFMSPEVACNRFYFVIVLVALPFVFFMCRLLPSFLSPARSPARGPFFISSPACCCCCCYCCRCALLGQIGGLINQICHSNLGVRIFFLRFRFYFLYFYNIRRRPQVERGQAERAMKCVKAAEKIFKGGPHGAPPPLPSTIRLLQCDKPALG